MMKPVGTAVEHMLKKLNLWQGYQQFLLIEQWPEIVGIGLAEVTRADSISRGVLKVAVKDSVWAYHLNLLKPQLIEKLNQGKKKKLVHDIYFKIEERDSLKKE